MKTRIIVLVALIGGMAIIMPLFIFPLTEGSSQTIQNATVSKNTTAVEIRNQNGFVELNYWKFVGNAHSTDGDPVNDKGEKQDISEKNKAIATIYNADEYTMRVHLTFSAWNLTGIVGTEYYAITSKDTNAVGVSFTTIPYDEQIDTGISIASEDWKNLWLKLELLSKGEVESNVMVESEVA